MDYFELVQKAVDWIEEHSDERVQVRDLARAAYCSEAHFSRVFRAIVGLSVMEYVRCRRLSLAGRELSLTQSKILDIALNYGYETPQSFTKAFKKFHGISPIACRKKGTSKYLERSFPLVIKMKMIEGAKNMDKFGSPLQQIMEELGNESANMYFCFNIGNQRYAIEATSVWSIMGVWDLYQNTEGKLWQFLWGNNRPVIRIDEMTGFEKISEGQHNILQCRTKDTPRAGIKGTVGKGTFGLVIDGIPTLQIVKSIVPVAEKAATPLCGGLGAAPPLSDGNCESNFLANKKPFISTIGCFEDEEIFIIDTKELWLSQTHQLTDVFDKAEASVGYTLMEKDSPQKRLEYAAYKAELIARNASIEAANGGECHKGTMIVAHELHQHAMEIAKIAQDMRKTQEG